MNTRALGLQDRAHTVPATDVLAIVQRGLRTRPRRLPSWLFYDARGSALFERICEQPEYYLTRCEIALMQVHAASIADTLGADVRLVEYGSGSAIKTRQLLEHMRSPVSYVPVEISPEPLQQSVLRLARWFPRLPVQPLCSDFTGVLRLPSPPRTPRRTVVYVPGSTIGNFDTSEASALLRKMRTEVGTHGGILIGADLKKDPVLLEAAYNDAAGVTALFTLNMLTRLNRELGSDFDLAGFRHRARYNAIAGRIETSLVSQRAQKVRIGDAVTAFGEDEPIHVEISCKYSLEDFASLARRSGLRVRRVWQDPQDMFSVQYLEGIGSE